MVNQKKKFVFRITGKISSGEDVSPEVFDIKQIKPFFNDVCKFVEAGSDSSRESIGVLAEEGSWKLIVLVSSSLYESLVSDIKSISSNELELVNPIRREIVSNWQKQYKKTDLNIEIGPSEGDDLLIINKNSNFELEDFWFETEDIFYGIVENLGGAQKPNMHLRTGNGLLLVDATKEELKNIQKNVALYEQEIGVSVYMKKNMRTGGISDLKYKSHCLYSKELSEEDLDKLIRVGTSDWKGVNNAVDWVNQMRFKN